MLRQHYQDHGFLFSELLRNAVPGAGAERPEINFVAGKLQHRTGGSCGCVSIPVPTPQDRAYPQEKFLQVKGLRHVIVTARFQARHPVGGIAPRG
jgi:hypothetical protein